MRQAAWVYRVRASVAAKNQRLTWVEGHVGIEQNEVSDKYAKLGSTLPKPPPMQATSPWDIVRHGELMHPPHKTWTHDLIPSHSHDGFHPITWHPRKF